MNARLVQLLALVACAALVLSSSLFTSEINAGRARLDMMAPESAPESAPKEYVFAVQALGAFRGLLTNIAFIRAEEFKAQGRYYDAMQLASWICTLQPRFPSVWEFHAWNMAWNISVTTYTPEERWNWVYNGAKLLRDQGIPANPRSVNLYKQLAWIFVNKMSETTDQYHLAYKRNWAWRMHLLLGTPPDPIGDYHPDREFEFVEGEIGKDRLADAMKIEAQRRVEKLRKRVEERGQPWDRDALEAAELFLASLEKEEANPDDKSLALTPYEVVRRTAYDRMLRIAEAPDTVDELIAQHPDAERMIRELQELGIFINDDPIIEEKYMGLDAGLMYTFFYRYRMLTERPALLAEVVKDPRPDEDVAARERLGEILGVADEDPAGVALVRFLQKKVLRDVYKMDAATMAELMATFGPMDWRVVDAHSLYWVNKGLIAGRETISQFSNDKTNTARMIFFSLRNLMQRNKLTFEPYTRDVSYAYMNFNPDLNFIEPMHQAYLTYGAMQDPEPEKVGAGVTYRTGHINFLAEAIRMLYFADRIPEASHYFEYLRTTYGIQADGSKNPRYMKPLVDFVVETTLENADTPNEERARIFGLVVQAFDVLAQGNFAQCDSLLEAARRAHQQYNSGFEEEEVEKMRLPEFNEMQLDILERWYIQPPINPVALLDKVRLWTYLPTDSRLEVYDRVIAQLRQECEVFEFDLARAFPPPEGLEAYREEFAGRAREKEESRVETPAQNEQ